MKTIVTQAFLLAAFAGTTLSYAAEDIPRGPESGRWITESGNFEVDIAPCGQALCGTVVRVIANRSMRHPANAMQAADGRSPLGLKLLTDFKPTGEREWQGRIYNREDGETYDCLIELLAQDQLKVRAYKGIPLFGKTQVWRRVTGEQE